MRHYIIVKFEESINIDNIIEPIKELFNQALKIEGVKSIEVKVKNIDLPNRHDLMIEMNLTKEALNIFDNSEIHKKWKEEYGKYIVNKTIFDCE